MSVHLQREIDRLKESLVLLCRLVEERVTLAVKALLERDPALAEQVENGDRDINQREVEVEEDCLRVLALYQPVAMDLRVTVAVLRISNDLERVGDLAVNIARKVVAVAGNASVTVPDILADMAAKSQSMLHDSIAALVALDAPLAACVCARDDEVDRLKQAFRRDIENQIEAHPEQLRSLLRLLAVARNLERIADSATNIAEDVLYMVKGRITRHGDGA
ncbi:MAG: phosphate signaling complex protein PhoU [Pirellulaceae bacterium]|jgi:phosphate transport system protein|nr:phosphate signaling complex protein PhoU [Pirellulaceae bacterium]